MMKEWNSSVTWRWARQDEGAQDRYWLLQSGGSHSAPSRLNGGPGCGWLYFFLFQFCLFCLLQPCLCQHGGRVQSLAVTWSLLMLYCGLRPLGVQGLAFRCWQHGFHCLLGFYFHPGSYCPGYQVCIRNQGAQCGIGVRMQALLTL